MNSRPELCRRTISFSEVRGRHEVLTVRTVSIVRTVSVLRSPSLVKRRRANYRRGMSVIKRIHLDQCCGAIIDYQDFFLAQLEPRSRTRLRKNMRNFARL